MNGGNDLFTQINDAVLDLQSADLQSYPTPLKRLGRLLRHTDLTNYVERLTQGVDLDEFIRKSEATQGGMVGSAKLDWPDNDQEILGLKLLLLLRFCDNPDYMSNFGFQFFWSGSNKIISGINAITSQIIIPFVRDFKRYVGSGGDMEPTLIVPQSNRVFVVHGHDIAARETVARFLSKIGFHPVILNEQANQGQTIIEKIETNRDVGFAVVLLTPDDMGRSKTEAELSPRVRENVLLELGYFMCHLGRRKICALKKGVVAVPSDFAGVVWTELDDAGGWKIGLVRELLAVGYQFDVKKAVE